MRKHELTSSILIIHCVRFHHRNFIERSWEFVLRHCRYFRLLGTLYFLIKVYLSIFLYSINYTNICITSSLNIIKDNLILWSSSCLIVIINCDFIRKREHEVSCWNQISKRNANPLRKSIMTDITVGEYSPFCGTIHIWGGKFMRKMSLDTTQKWLYHQKKLTVHDTSFKWWAIKTPSTLKNLVIPGKKKVGFII